MNHILVSSLSPEQTEKILELYNQFEVVSIEQYPGFAAANTTTDIMHYIQTDAAQAVTAYAQISVRRFRIATIAFGPIAISAAAFKSAVEDIKKFCAKNLVPVLRITPPFFISAYGQAYYDDLMTAMPFETSDREINWSTMVLDISLPEEELLKSFSENHRRSVKKAIKMELTTQVVDNHGLVSTFSDQHSDMYEKRGLAIDRGQSKEQSIKLFDFFQQTGLGLFLMVFEKDVPIGGICCSIQGNAMRYLEGYSHPDYRQHPITHIAFYKAIRIAKQKGLQSFDMGGYANNVQEGDQLSAINRFKDGFRGQIVNYPQTMMIYTLPLAKWLYSLKKK